MEEQRFTHLLRDGNFDTGLSAENDSGLLGPCWKMYVLEKLEPGNDRINEEKKGRENNVLSTSSAEHAPRIQKVEESTKAWLLHAQ